MHLKILTSIFHNKLIDSNETVNKNEKILTRLLLTTQNINEIINNEAKNSTSSVEENEELHILC